MPGNPGLEAVVGVVARASTCSKAASPSAVVAHEEDRAAALVGVVVGHERCRRRASVNGLPSCRSPRRCHRLACRAGPGWRRGRSRGCRVNTLLRTPRDPDAAERAAVASTDLRANVLPPTYTGWLWDWAERADRAATEVGPGPVAAVAEEGRVHDLQPSAADEDRASAAAVAVWPVELPSAKVRFWTMRRGHAWSSQCVGGPDLRLVAGVLVEDAPRAAAARA